MRLGRFSVCPPDAGLESPGGGVRHYCRSGPIPHLAPLLAVRLLRFTGTVIVAAVVAFLSLLLVVRFLVFPAVDDYRDRIAAHLTKDLGQPVSIESIAGGWDGWNPRLSIRGFAIRDKAKPEGPPVLLLPQVD